MAGSAFRKFFVLAILVIGAGALASCAGVGQSGAGATSGGASTDWSPTSYVSGGAQ